MEVLYPSNRSRASAQLVGFQTGAIGHMIRVKKVNGQTLKMPLVRDISI